MDESTIKGLKLNDRDADIRETRSISEVSVEGYCSLPFYALKLALRKHFASCGKILSVNFINKSVAIIRFEGEGSQEKALELSGTDVGGWNAIVKPVKAAREPRQFNPSDARIKECDQQCRMLVTGYDTCLAEIDIQIALCNHFSLCGEVKQVMVLPSLALIIIEGERCAGAGP